jgi:hypothetical protein
MRVSRLRKGEIVVGLGAVALLVSLFLDWFEPADAPETGWESLGWLALLPLVVTIALGLALVVATVAERTPALPLALGVIVVPWALLACLAIVVRLIAQPGANAVVEVLWPAYLGLAGAAAALAGAWIALADERTDTKQSRAQTERALSVRGEPRPVPPPRDTPPRLGDE